MEIAISDESVVSVVDIIPVTTDPKLSLSEEKCMVSSLSSKSKSSKSRQSADEDSRYSKSSKSSKSSSKGKYSKNRFSEDEENPYPSLASLSSKSKKSAKNGKSSKNRLSEGDSDMRYSKNRYPEAGEVNPYPSLPKGSPSKSRKIKWNRASEDAGLEEIARLSSFDGTYGSQMRERESMDLYYANDEEEDDTHYSRFEIKQCLVEMDAKVGKFYHPYDIQELQDLLSPIYTRSPKLLRRVLNYSLSGDSNIKTSDNLLWRALEGHSPLNCIQVLLDYGIRVEFKAGVLGETPLMLCTEQLMYENVKILLEYGANANARDDQDRNVLYYWLLKARTWQLIARLRVLTLLIRHGADPSAFLQVNSAGDKDYEEAPRLTVCALEYAYNNDQEQVFEHLLRANHLKHRHIIETLLSRAVQEDKKKYVEYIVKSSLLSVHNIPTLITYYGNDHSIPLKLVEKSKEIDHKIGSQPNRPTSLIWATHYGYNDIVLAFIKEGADLDLTDTDRNTACITAARCGNLVALQLLITNGCDCEKKNVWGNTVLMSAAERGEVDMLKFLIKKGNVDVNTTNLKGQNALYFAVYANHINSARVLIDKGVQISDTLLLLAIEKGYNEMATILISKSVDLDKVHSAAFLQSAVLNRNEDLAITLIEHNANSDIRTDGDNSLLHYIASFGLLRTFKALLKHRECDVNITNNRGETPLMYALSCDKADRIEVVKTFLDAGANVNARDDHGDSALMKCVRKDDKALVEVLVNNGADITVTTKSGDSLAIMAALRGNTDIIQFLLFKGLSQHDQEDSTFLASYIRRGADDSAFLERLYTAVPVIDLSLQSKISRVSPLQVALQRGYVGTVSFLLKHDVHLFEGKTIDLYNMIGKESDEITTEQREDIKRLLKDKNILEKSSCSVQ